MSDGCVSAIRPSFRSKSVDYAPLFDWVADCLAVATPQNVCRVLRVVDDNGYIRRFGAYIPQRYESTCRQFRRLSELEQDRQAQMWFENIEPGFLALGTHQ
jgi:hypothetical protein